MAAPFSTTSAINYNSNPPSDDGSQTPSNRVLWATQKTKLADPIKTAFDTSETNTSTAFGKVPGGAGITSVATDYTVLASDQGKLVRVTASGHVVTTPDATAVGAPFLFCLVNDSTGTITFTGSNPGVQQTVDGATSLTILPNVGYWVNTDGTNWFTYGQNFGQLVGSMMSYGAIVNGTIVESNTSNAVTFALKTLAGNDPSTSDPVLIAFRNATQTLGNYVFRSVTSATSLVISAGSTLGAPTGSVAFDISLVLFDDAGTIRIGAINLAGTGDSSIYPLAQSPTVASSTAEGGAGAADSSKTFYTGTAVTSKAYIPFAQARYTAGLSTAGNWNVDPKLQLYGPGVPIPRSLDAREIPYGPKAWVTWTMSGSTVTVQKSFNVTSVVRNSAGKFTITFTNAMTDAFYVPTIAVQGNDNMTAAISSATGPSTAALVISILLSGTPTDPSQVSVSIIGN